MRGRHIRRDTQDDGFQFQEFAIQVTESLGFLRSPGCIVLWVKVNDHMFTLKVFQSHHFAVRIRQTERRRGLSFLYAHIILLK